MVTSNHVHLLVFDKAGRNIIPDAMKLVAGRTGQEYNIRKNRRGASWEDRYHATAVQTNRYLRQCIAYIDMNMVRAGVVAHPEQWAFCGYQEMQNPRKRKGIIDFDRLIELLGFNHYDDLKAAHTKWVASALEADKSGRQKKWTETIAIGSRSFVEKIKAELGFKAKGRKIICAGSVLSFGKSRYPLAKRIAWKTRTLFHRTFEVCSP